MSNVSRCTDSPADVCTVLVLACHLWWQQQHNQLEIPLIADVAHVRRYDTRAGFTRGAPGGPPLQTCLVGRLLQQLQDAAGAELDGGALPKTEIVGDDKRCWCGDPQPD